MLKFLQFIWSTRFGWRIQYRRAPWAFLATTFHIVGNFPAMGGGGGFSRFSQLSKVCENLACGIMHTYTMCIPVVPRYGGAVVLWTTHKNSRSSSYSIRTATILRKILLLQLQGAWGGYGSWWCTHQTNNLTQGINICTRGCPGSCCVEWGSTNTSWHISIHQT